MFYMFFLSFVLWILSVSPLSDIVSTSADFTVTPPVCEIGGWTALFDIIACAAGNIVYFFQFMTLTIAEGYGWLWTLLFAPLLITLTWIIVELLRGTG